MTIEGAIAELQNLIKADDVPFYYNGAIQKVIETIVDECKPTKGKWIPTDQEKPKDNTKVLVTRDVFVGVPLVKIAGYSSNLHKLDPYDFSGKEYKREGFVDYDDEWGFYEVTNVLAWMPLPEPYERKTNEHTN